MLTKLQFLIIFFPLLPKTSGHQTSNSTALVFCGPGGIFDNSPKQSNLDACKTYLNEKGNDICHIDKYRCSRFCNIGDAFVSGVNFREFEAIDVPCTYIADAVQEIAQSCWADVGGVRRSKGELD
jgi:hypothetical protein